MRSLRSIHTYLGIAAAAAALLTAPLASAQAQGDGQEAIVVTFSGPVEVPGTTLDAGTYLITEMDATSSEQVVQIFNEDESKLFATALTVPVKRLDQTGDVIIRFAETTEGTAPALKAYFYPGTTRGKQFVYPKTQAQEIAKRTKTLVLSSDRDDITAEELRQAKVSVVSDRGEAMEYSAGAVDWRDDGWKNPPMVRSGEKAGKAMAKSEHGEHHGVTMAGDDQRQLVNDTAEIISSVLDEAGNQGTVTISREQLEKVHRNLESLRGSFQKAKHSSGETD